MKELVAHMASENEIRWEKEIEILKDEGVPQTAMKEKEKQLVECFQSRLLNHHQVTSYNIASSSSGNFQITIQDLHFICSKIQTQLHTEL